METVLSGRWNFPGSYGAFRGLKNYRGAASGGGGGLGSLSYAATVLADGPLAYWRMNETSGTTLSDSSGNGYHLTAPAGYIVNQASAVGMTDSKSVRTDDTNGISLPAGLASTLLGSAQWTIEGWFTTNAATGSTSGTGGDLFAATVSTNSRVRVYHSGSTVRTQSNAGGGNSGKPYGANLWMENWHHFLVQSNGDLWVNGVALNYRAGESQASSTVAGRIGANTNATSPWKGWIAEFAVYQKHIGAAGVAARWHAANNFNIDPLPQNRTWRWTFESEVPNVRIDGSAPRAYYFASATRQVDALSRHSGYVLNITGAWAAAKFMNNTNYHRFASLQKGAIKCGWRYSGTLSATYVVFFLDGKDVSLGNDAEGGQSLRVSSSGWVIAGNTYGTAPTADTWYDITLLWDRTHPTKKVWLLINGVEIYSTNTIDTTYDPLAYHQLLIGNDTITGIDMKFDYFELHGSPTSTDL